MYFTQKLFYSTAVLFVLLSHTIAQTTEDLCEFEQPELIQNYWPVLVSDPEQVAGGQLPILDVFVGDDGVPLNFSLVNAEFENDRDILELVCQSLRFTPAYACGEKVDGFYRHLVRSYFYPEKKQKNEFDTLPASLFSLPPSVIDNLEKVVFLTVNNKNRVFNFKFTITPEGIAEKVRGVTPLDDKLAEVYIGKLLPKLPFQPAKLNGEPMAVEMHLRLDLRMGISPRQLAEGGLRKPMPKRPEIGSFEEGKEHSVLLDLYMNGAVRNIQFLTLMNRDEALAVLNAFRLWKTEPQKKDNRGIKRLKVNFAFMNDAPQAVLLSEELDTFEVAPRPLKQPPPDYPENLHRLGVTGLVVLEFFVDKTGKVRNPRAKLATHEDFARAALKMIEKWKFKPGELNGEPVTTKVRLPIPFRIRQD